MHILLIILKITGIILLTILIFLVCLAVMVLFVPLRYRIKALFGEDNKRTKSQADYSVSVKAKWLLGIVSVNFVYPDYDRQVIKLFGIPFRKRNKKRTKKNRTKKTKSEPVKTSKPKEQEEAVKSKEQEKPVRPVEVKKKKQAARKEKKHKFRRMKKTKEKKGRIKQIKTYYGILSDSENKNAFSFLKKTLFSLIRHSAPDKLVADLVIGLGDPCNTGFLFGGLGLLISVVKGKYNITPDFYNKRIDGRVYLKGKIRSVVVIYHLIKVFTNRDVKKVTNQFKTMH